MAVQLWDTLKESITAYTGLSPAAFFTVLALGLAVYYVVSGMFGSSDRGRNQRPRDLEEQMKPLPPPIQLGEITEEELKMYDGSDPQKPLLMAIKGQIYDVSQSRMFYGPGGPYALFAGKDASRALAKMSFEEKDLTGDISGLGVFEIEALQDWEYKFMSKYVKVGTIKNKLPVAEASTASEREVNDRDIVMPSEDAGPSEDGKLESESDKKPEEGPLEDGKPESDLGKKTEEDQLEDGKSGYDLGKKPEEDSVDDGKSEHDLGKKLEEDPLEDGKSEHGSDIKPKEGPLEDGESDSAIKPEEDLKPVHDEGKRDFESAKPAEGCKMDSSSARSEIYGKLDGDDSKIQEDGKSETRTVEIEETESIEDAGKH